MWNPIRAVIAAVERKDPLLVAHHPTCEFYDHHTFTLYGTKVCMGCFIVYPVSAATLLTLSSLWLLWPELGLFGLSTRAFYGIGFALISPIGISKLVSGTRTEAVRMRTKASLAVGLGVLAFPFVARPADRLLTAGLFVGFLVPYIVHKGLTVTDDCEGCPEADEFPNCSGLTFDDEIDSSDYSE